MKKIFGRFIEYREQLINKDSDFHKKACCSTELTPGKEIQIDDDIMWSTKITRLVNGIICHFIQIMLSVICPLHQSTVQNIIYDCLNMVVIIAKIKKILDLIIITDEKDDRLLLPLLHAFKIHYIALDSIITRPKKFNDVFLMTGSCLGFLILTCISRTLIYEENLITVSKAEFVHGLMGTITLLEKSFPHKNNQTNEIFSMAKSCGEHLHTLIGNLLEYSKLKAKKIEINKSSIDMMQGVKNIVKMNYFKSKERNNRLNLFISHNFPRKLLVDEQRINQILINLISNAIKFTEKGCVNVYVGWRPGFSNVESQDYLEAKQNVLQYYEEKNLFKNLGEKSEEENSIRKGSHESASSQIDSFNYNQNEQLAQQQRFRLVNNHRGQQRESTLVQNNDTKLKSVNKFYQRSLSDKKKDDLRLNNIQNEAFKITVQRETNSSNVLKLTDTNLDLLQKGDHIKQTNTGNFLYNKGQNTTFQFQEDSSLNDNNDVFFSNSKGILDDEKKSQASLANNNFLQEVDDYLFKDQEQGFDFPVESDSQLHHTENEHLDNQRSIHVRDGLQIKNIEYGSPKEDEIERKQMDVKFGTPKADLITEHQRKIIEMVVSQHKKANSKQFTQQSENDIEMQFEDDLLSSRRESTLKNFKEMFDKNEMSVKFITSQTPSKSDRINFKEDEEEFKFFEEQLAKKTQSQPHYISQSPQNLDEALLLKSVLLSRKYNPPSQKQSSQIFSLNNLRPDFQPNQENSPIEQNSSLDQKKNLTTANFPLDDEKRSRVESQNQQLNSNRFNEEINNDQIDFNMQNSEAMSLKEPLIHYNTLNHNERKFSKQLDHPNLMTDSVATFAVNKMIKIQEDEVSPFSKIELNQNISMLNNGSIHVANSKYNTPFLGPGRAPKAVMNMGELLGQSIEEKYLNDNLLVENNFDSQIPKVEKKRSKTQKKINIRIGELDKQTDDLIISKGLVKNALTYSKTEEESKVNKAIISIQHQNYGSQQIKQHIQQERIKVQDQSGLEQQSFGIPTVKQSRYPTENQVKDNSDFSQVVQKTKVTTFKLDGLDRTTESLEDLTKTKQFSYRLTNKQNSNNIQDVLGHSLINSHENMNDIGLERSNTNLLLSNMNSMSQSLLRYSTMAFPLINSNIPFDLSSGSMYSSEKGILEIKVTDDGIGMSQESLKRIFQPYAQADRTIAKKFGGTGLGLCICKELIQVMNGKIDVESKLGQGTQFFVQVPLEISADLTSYVEENDFDREFNDVEIKNYEFVVCNNEKSYGVQQIKKIFLKKQGNIVFKELTDFSKSDGPLQLHQLFKTVRFISQINTFQDLTYKAFIVDYQSLRVNSSLLQILSNCNEQVLLESKLNSPQISSVPSQNQIPSSPLNSVNVKIPVIVLISGFLDESKIKKADNIFVIKIPFDVRSMKKILIFLRRYYFNFINQLGIKNQGGLISQKTQSINDFSQINDLLLSNQPDNKALLSQRSLLQQQSQCLSTNDVLPKEILLNPQQIMIRQSSSKQQVLLQEPLSGNSITTGRKVLFMPIESQQVTEDNGSKQKLSLNLNEVSSSTILQRFVASNNPPLVNPYYHNGPYTTDNKGSARLNSQRSNQSNRKMTSKNIPYTRSSDNHLKCPQYALIVNDDQFTRKITSMLLDVARQDANKEFEILNAQNGKEAVETYKTVHNIKLILMDVEMPIMDGYEATKKIREYEEEIKNVKDSVPSMTYIIGVSGNSDLQHFRHCQSVGMNEAVIAPITNQKLIEVLNNLF